MRVEGARRRAAVRLRRFWAALVVASLPLAASAEPPSDAAVLDAFGRIAFGEENVPDADPRIQKWTQAIRWRAYEALPLDEGDRAFLGNHMERLARLTGLDIAPAPSWPDANFIVLFVAEERYEATILRYLAPSRRHLLGRL